MTQAAKDVRAKVRAIYFEREAKIDARRWEAYHDQFEFRDALGSDEAYNVLFGEGWFGRPGPRGLPSDFDDRVERAVAALLARHRAPGFDHAKAREVLLEARHAGLTEVSHVRQEQPQPSQ